MPMYNVEHTIPLTEQQKNKLAEAITKIHTEKFTVPRFFVNINIRDISSEWTYGAGNRVSVRALFQLLFTIKSRL
jgi:phenylpyruvate tautomerase PptA (4-oxalocrotonate tautomerase family)